MDFTNLGVMFIGAIVPVVTTVLVYLIRLAIPKIPRVALPFISVILPIAASWFYSFVEGGTFTPIIAALLGAAAVWLREVVNTYNEHGTQS